MNIDTLVLGLYETNCYVLRAGRDAEDCLIIDPGLGAEPLIAFLREHSLKPAAVVLTHGHIDHVEGVAALRRHYPDVRLAIHKADAEMLTDPQTNLALMMGDNFTTEPAEILLDDGSHIEQAGLDLEVLHTPGHTPGGICLYSPAEAVVFTDDTLFAGSIGRSDFPGGSHSQLIRSIRDKLLTLPEQTQVFPGHGPQTTIAQEKSGNPFL